jgi:hypothetical protein
MVASIATMLIAVAANDAHAQYEPAPLRPAPQTKVAKQRDGILAGASFGFGTLAMAEESNGTWNYQLQFGGFLSNQTRDNLTATALQIGVQYY